MKIRVVGKRREQPDARKLARVVIELAEAKAEIKSEVEPGERGDRADRAKRGEPRTRGDAV
ncbi:MAG TPA: hypothetical protein VEW93_07000 [Acidimicrobiales bacterium]|nr:hypothetical protein [Acidimicrobiales bacterium]